MSLGVSTLFTKTQEMALPVACDKKLACSLGQQEVSAPYLLC